MAFERSSLKNHFGDPAGEVRACREESALFDFSFLECARIRGHGARAVIAKYAQRPLDKLAQNKIAYAVRTDASGIAVADLTVWRTGIDCFEVMSGRREDVADLVASGSERASVVNVGEGRAVFSVQGPGALNVLRKLGKVDTIANLLYFQFSKAELAGVRCMVGRLGYSGEAGFEIIFPRSEASRIWHELSQSARPAGFIAADTLRIEAGFVLFANEFSLPVSPAEAGLQRFHFEQDRQAGRLKLVCFCAEADRFSVPWKSEVAVERPNEPGVVAVTSACRSTLAGGILGLGFVVDATAKDAALHDPSRQFRNICQLRLPFYDTFKSRPRLAWR